MLKAVSIIISGDKVFEPGQVVAGLSPIDMEWMKKAGYILDEASSTELGEAVLGCHDEAYSAEDTDGGQRDEDGYEL